MLTLFACSLDFLYVEYSHDVMMPMDDTNMRPVADWHPPIVNTVYHGMDWLCPGYCSVLARQLNKHWGNLTAEAAIQVSLLVKGGSPCC